MNANVSDTAILSHCFQRVLLNGNGQLQRMATITPPRRSPNIRYVRFTWTAAGWTAQKQPNRARTRAATKSRFLSSTSVPPERTPLGWHSSERRRANGQGNPLSSMAGIVFAAFKPSSAATFPHGFSAQLAASRQLQPAGMRKVEVWRGGVRLSMSVSAPFVWRCLSGSAVAPFPHPAHR